jgi:hypothetical protein
VVDQEFFDNISVYEGVKQGLEEAIAYKGAVSCETAPLDLLGGVPISQQFALIFKNDIR